MGRFLMCGLVSSVFKAVGIPFCGRSNLAEARWAVGASGVMVGILRSLGASCLTTSFCTTLG
ncbi:predicted protein [Plenodomus lingam JN3]|uniref:Predicted protein n=1 Tax=Leptosphaeria maculans (strain JN3 / isolate v23.1.3 / race Av1-4-5-6-7-8) TaxID=985895 RepID=E4ZMU2_LEPMJ|nr:predicted protein [Plenodomus lingam JN3]CBX92545.1 predicted protein [Plenodomus lingam JN3]